MRDHSGQHTLVGFSLYRGRFTCCGHVSDVDVHHATRSLVPRNWSFGSHWSVIRYLDRAVDILYNRRHCCEPGHLGIP